MGRILFLRGGLEGEEFYLALKAAIKLEPSSLVASHDLLKLGGSGLAA